MNVYWLHGRELCWDQHLIAEAFDALGWQSLEGPPQGSDACVLVVPARYHTADEIEALVAPLDDVLLILTSDEESTFDHTRFPDAWVMTPRTQVHRALGEGYPPGTREMLASCDPDDRSIDVFFAGQVTHPRREACVAAAETLDVETVVHSTDGFLQGMDRGDYLALMASTKLALCPSGPATVDSFRIFEALEAGCVPIADATCPANNYPDYYWSLLFPVPPFPIIGDWSDLAKYVDAELEAWPGNANRCFAWWQQQKRLLRTDLQDAVGEQPDDPVTVIVVTSPIPSHPSTDVIVETIRSIRDRLPTAEILVMCDGVRAEQEDRRADYDEYLRRLLWLCNTEWDRVTPFVADTHQHQANLTRLALEHVRTPTILFVEHDTPLVGDVDWSGCVAAIESGRANVIRFHHEASVLEPHRHLMLDVTPQNIEGVPLLGTVQWSQRPHLASTGFYRSMIAAWFGVESRTMIEDVMHGVVDAAFHRHRHAGWAQFRLWMYAPDGDIKRSTHLDGREGDEKYPMLFAYDGATPYGAPNPVRV